MNDNSSKFLGISRYKNMRPEQDRESQLTKIYADWAATYDHDNDHALGTVSQPNAIELLEKYVTDLDAEILDVGCGTGQVGLHLADAGFTTFDGTDISDDMLQIAQTRGYRTLVQSNADEGLPFEDNAYDNTICVGLFTHGHIGPGLISELIRVTRPNGLIVFTVNEGVWKSEGFNVVIDRLTDVGKWDLLAKIRQPYMVKEDVEGWYVAARKPT